MSDHVVPVAPPTVRANNLRTAKPAARAEDRPVMTQRRESNVRRNREEYRQGETHLRSRPLALFIELTQNCNLRCPSCRSEGPYRRDWNLGEDIFSQVADELFDDALLVDLRGWGESTILRSFAACVDRTLDSGAQLRLVTNGMANPVEVWERMMAASSLISVSCDAADPSLFRVLRAGGDLHRLKRTVHQIVLLRDEFHVHRDNVSLQVVVSLPNISDLAGIVDLADGLDIARVVMGPIQIGRDHPWHLRNDVEGTRRGIDAAVTRARQLGVELQLGSALDPALALPSDVKDACMHPWAFCYISHEGRVGFCDHLIGNAKYTFGTIGQRPFDDIWNGEDWQELRASHVRRSLPDRFSPCRWCFKQRYVDFEQHVYPEYEARRVSTKTRLDLYEVRDPLACQATDFLDFTAEA